MDADIKLSRSNNEPWGLRLSGGVDFSFPLTVVRVTIGGLADKAGLKAGDIIVSVNGQPMQQLTHDQAHEIVRKAGNEMQLTVARLQKIHKSKQEK